ncbi:PLDc N-terminal domain-containing protein [Cloacibacterium sp.]|jgi:hypothetical protein|uniref:PLDc N-terminal domain-containing protein n=1 Tax=Cloacibacterium sp. TaxID=1913682 RepID=UPI0035B0B493
MFLSLSAMHLIIVSVFLFLPTLLWIIALVDILKSNFKDSNNKILWVLVVILLPIIGSILYFIIGKNQKI